MEDHKFYQFGDIVYTLRWYIIALWVISLLACIPFLPNIMNPFKTTGFIDEKAESTHVTQYLNQHLGFNSTNKFLVMYHSPNLLASDPIFANNIKKSLSSLEDLPFKSEIIYPGDHKNQISKNKHTAYAVVIVKDKLPISDDLLDRLKSSIKKPRHMTMQLGGEPIFVDDMNHQTQTDLYKADFIATPVAIVTMILVFGSLVAAILPILLGGGSAMIILTLLYYLGHFFTLSVFTINIALLLGLCLCLDYSLFIISRFRDELRTNQPIRKVIARTQATAGKAIFYSGLAVFASLSALFIFPINILFSVAVGGLVAVVVAVITANVFLPAILSVLNTNINRLAIRVPKHNRSKLFNRWHWIAEKVVNHPLTFFFPILILLLMLGYPFLSAKLGVSDFHIFPEHSENRRFFDSYSEQFHENNLSPILLVIKTHHQILSSSSISDLYSFTHRLKQNPGIAEVNSIVSLDSKITKQQYQQIYQHPSLISPDMKTYLSTTTGHHFTVIDIISKHHFNSPETALLIRDLPNTKLKPSMSMSLTGTPIANKDVLKTISHYLPYAILWIMGLTYLILLLLLRSIVLPLKALVMNMLSLSACYGALVLVFQDGYLHQLLHFDPQGMLDISLLVIIFCALFGFSMDYEVFLLTRIKEAYDSTHDTKKSIIFGIEKSGRIITSAALIVIFICGSFLVADVLMVKAFGFGIAIAIFVDAFLIRSFLVPSTMTLLNEWNWYLPKWLDRILPHC
ncbi:MAG: MMPL family transporter [Legionellales bacterium]|nr:MMPL family transporter [Legionellales bacterium]